MGRVLILIPFLTWGYLTFAQPDSSAIDLPDIVVHANRLDLPFSDQSRSVVILDRKTIRDLPVSSVAEVLQYIPGLDLRQRGVHGVQADLSIRGSTFDQVLVLINGIKMIDPQTGHHAMSLPVNLQNIERIEVLKGPGARVFGPNAFAGAINIITKVPEDGSLDIQLQGGSHELGGARIGISIPKNNFDQYFSYSRDFSAGYRYNSDYDISNVFYQNQFSFINQEVRLIAGHSERKFGANGFYASPEARDQYEALQTSLVALEYRNKGLEWVWKPRIYWRRNQDEYLFVRQNPSIYRNLHISNVTGAEINVTRFGQAGTTGMGLDLQYICLRSNNLGERNRLSLTAFLEHRFTLFADRMDISPGIAINYFSDFGTKAYPGIDLGFKLTNSLKAYGDLGYTYRIPTFTDLYYEDPNNLGNPELNPESAFSFEVGIKYLKGDINLQAGYFSRLGRDLIDWTRETANSPWKPLNFNNLNMSGLDISGQLVTHSGKSDGFTLKEIRIGYTYINAQVLDHEFQYSRYALENLKHQILGGLTIATGKWTLSARYRFLDRSSLEDYSIIDSRLQYGWDKFRAYLDASNLLDQTYTGANLVPMPGLWIRAGMNFSLGI